MAKTRKKFATQVDSAILKAIRRLAEKEGRQLQALVEEAFADLLEKREKAGPRAHIIEAYLGSHEQYGPLYTRLAE